MKLNLAGLIGYLQGKGMKVHLNEDASAEEDAFEVIEDPAPVVVPEVEEEEASPPDETLSAEELKALKNFATVLAKNGKLIEAIESGTLDTALNTVPAAAELVRNAQAREKLEKDQLIATIKANSSNVYSDEELGALPNPVLVKLNAQMNVNYMGMGGAVIQNAEQPLGLPTSLLAQVEEARNGS